MATRVKTESVMNMVKCSKCAGEFAVVIHEVDHYGKREFQVPDHVCVDTLSVKDSGMLF